MGLRAIFRAPQPSAHRGRYPSQGQLAWANRFGALTTSGPATCGWSVLANPLTFIYGTELKVTQERWPDIAFHELREHAGLVFQQRI